MVLVLHERQLQNDREENLQTVQSPSFSMAAKPATNQGQIEFILNY